MEDILQRAKLELKARQEEYRDKRMQESALIRKNLPRAQEIADEIRHLFMESMEKLLIRGEDISGAKEKSLLLQHELKTLLTKNGYDPQALYQKPMCKYCSDTGYIRGSQKCVCLKEIISGIQQSQLEELNTELRSFDRFRLDIFSSAIDSEWGLSQRENMEGNYIYCRTWSRTFGENTPNLFLNGKTGQGKTYLCACMSREVAAKGVLVKYTTAISMFNDLEISRFERQGPDTGSYYQSELLIIDDLGTEMTTAFIQSALYDMINVRLLKGRKTIINANLTSEELSTRYMPQICSRLLGEYKQLHFFGPDIRLRKRN